MSLQTMQNSIAVFRCAPDNDPIPGPRPGPCPGPASQHVAVPVSATRSPSNRQSGGLQYNISVNISSDDDYFIMVLSLKYSGA